MNMEEHLSHRSHRSSIIEEDNHTKNENNNNANDNHRIRAQGQASTGFGQAVNVNPSQWANQFYQTGTFFLISPFASHILFTTCSALHLMCMLYFSTSLVIVKKWSKNVYKVVRYVCLS